MAEAYKFPDEQEPQEENIEIETEESDIDLEIVDDTPEPDRGRKPLDRDVDDPSDDEIAEYSEKVQKRMKELTHARHDERRAKEAATREKEEAIRIAQKLIEENRALRQNVNKNQHVAVESIKAQAESALAMARKKLKEAQENYDTDAIIAAQEELAEAKYRSERIKDYKPTPLQEPQEQVYNQTETPQVPVPDQKALSWQQRNQWFGTDDEMTSLALAVHKKLVESGVDPRGNEYYERVDARMREVFPAFFGETKKENPSKRPANVVAAVSRTATGKTRVKLTKTQEALARKFGLTNEQYAKEVLKLTSES
jgi:hypothetical protein